MANGASEGLKGKVLVAEDDRDSLQLLSFLLEDDGWGVISAHTGEEVVQLAQVEHPCVMVLDNRMPGLTGAEAYNQLNLIGLHIPAILVSGAPDIDTIGRMSGVEHVLHKPIDVPLLLHTVEDSCKK